jgi:hypothetical protein
MKDYHRYHQILELWEQGKTQEEISEILAFPRYTVDVYVHHYGSVASFEKAFPKELGQFHMETDSHIKRRYTIPGYRSGRRRYTDEDVRDAVAGSHSLAEVLRLLQVRPAGGNYVTLKSRIKELGLDTSHFTGKGWLKQKRNPTVRERAMQEILVQNSNYMNTSKLRKRLIKEGYFEHRCASCNLTEWLDQPIPLEVDHINGDRHDNRLENLRLLCPNCHALTATYRGKNKNGQRAESA